MSNREKVRYLKAARQEACGIGTRKLKIRLNKLAASDPLALAVRIALEIEDANLMAKRYHGSYSDRYYFKKGELIQELINLFKHHQWTFGIHLSDRRYERGVIYFEIPGCEQLSWHYDHRGGPLPVYEKLWDGKEGTTLPKLFTFIQQEFLGPVKAQASLAL
jgi:hypothetical protein